VQRNLTGVGAIALEELSDLQRRHNEKLAKDLPSDELAERIFDEAYRRAQAVTRSTASRAGNTFETMSARIAEMGAPEPVNMLVSPSAVGTVSTTPLNRQKYLNGRQKPVVVSDVDRRAAERAAQELTRALYGEPEFPRLGSPEFHAILAERMQEVASAPRGDMWGHTVDLALTRDGIELLELKSGGEHGDKAFRGEVEDLLMTALAFNHPDVQVRFGFYKDVEGRTRTKLPPVFADGVAGGSALLIGRAFWEHILPDGVEYEDWLDIMALAGRHFPIGARSD
jgi:hypothetical protein